MRRKILLSAFVVATALLALGAYVALSIRPHLAAAEAALSNDVRAFSADQIDDLVEHLRAVDADLGSPPARLLRLLPVLRQNLAAVDAVMAASIPAVRTGGELQRALDEIEGAQLVRERRIRVEIFDRLSPALRAQAEALSALEAALDRHRSNWLLPPVWDRFEALHERVADLEELARRAAEGIELASPMLGYRGERRYLVLLINNAELRGAGGILSGIGTLTARKGTLDLGSFSHYFDLDQPPYETVSAPKDFKSRYSIYGADSTMLVNTTFSPDMPDVALVAARLFEEITGTKSDGVVVADPRGIAALLPPDATLRLPNSNRALSAEDVPGYVYSDAYRRFSNNEVRRDVLLEVGKLAFETALAEGTGSTETLERVGRAVAAGHLRMVSFRDDEQALLDRLDATGDLTAPPSDGFLVTTQNFSENKLDFWTKRETNHRCVVDPNSARCSTSVTLTNRAPPGLPQSATVNPDGLLKNLAEIYIPVRAELVSVGSSDANARFRRSSHDGYQVIASLLRMHPGDKASLTITYDLALQARRYSLVALPQPLARDARLDIALALPPRWEIEAGAGKTNGSVFRLTREFDRTIEIEAAPRQQRRGLAGLWDAFLAFWRKPLFG